MSDEGTPAPDVGLVVPDSTKSEAALAMEIRRRRTAAGLSQNQLADSIGYTRQYVSRAERLTGGCASAELVRVLDAELSAEGVLIALHATVLSQRTARRQRASHVGRDHSEHSSEVARVEYVTSPITPTSSTTPSSVATPSAVRGSMLLMSTNPSDGQMPLGAPEAGPYEYVVELERLHRVDQRGGPERALSGVEQLLGGIGTALAVSRGADRGALLRAASRAAEFAGFLYRDLGVEERCLYWHDRAMEFAQQSDDGPMQAYVLLRKAQAAYDRRDAPRMLDLTLAAARFGTALSPGLRAEIMQQQARGDAMLGASGEDIERRLDGAYALLSTVERHGSDDEPGCHYSERLLGLQSALCLSDAGRPRDAILRYRTIISSDLSPRDHAYFSILMATALALSGEPDEAAQLACSSLPVAMASSSRRSVREARTLAGALAPWRERHLVRELHDVLRSASASYPARDE